MLYGAGMSLLIQPADLAQLLRGDRPPALLDVRWQLGRSDGHEQYLAAHIPGAVYVDLDSELAGHGHATDGRHPLPTAAELQRAARRWGLRTGQPVVVHDASGNAAAARAWWLLRWAGITDVRLLDGGLRAWQAAGQCVASGEELPPPGDVVVDVERGPDGERGHLPTLSIADVAAAAREGVLLDARAGERYRGETEPIDPRAGHIPGAISAPTTENLDEAGRFLSADTLRQRFAALGVEGHAVTVYCGSGVTAAHQIAAMAAAGYDPARIALYPGSWSQWSNHPELPAATGPEPG